MKFDLLSRCNERTRAILDGSLEGREISDEEAFYLLEVTGWDYLALVATANDVCEQKKGMQVSFVVNRNINFTNICIHKCLFCAFSVPKHHPDAYFLTLEEIAQKVQEAIDAGCTEVCIQGGLHPENTVETYLNILKTVREISKDIHIHAFSPEEIRYACKQSHLTVEEVLSRYKDAGLGSIPGTAAEILVDSVRGTICPQKLTTREWITIITTAHKLGIPSTSTMMYGHVETNQDRIQHLRVLRNIQKETRGFTEFVPLPFMADEVKALPVEGGKTRGYGMDDLKMFAVARLYLQGWIDNIQCSWVKLGPRFAQTALYCGVNDFSGTLMEENISKSAGGRFGEYLPRETIISIIKNAGKRPVQRETTYNIIKEY